MNIAAVEVYRFDLPLKEALIFAEKKIVTRHGLLIILRDNAGHHGYGEAIPLPGFQQESAEECQHQLKSLAPRISGHKIPLQSLIIDGALSSFLSFNWLFPTVRFALEIALLNLLAAAQIVPLARALNSQAKDIIRLNALLMGTDSKLVSEAKKLTAQGYNCLKIKIGRGAIAKEKQIIQQIIQDTPPDVLLRLDANRSLTLDDALAFAEGLSAQRIEYIEEPVQNPAELECFFERSNLPYALDESLIQDDLLEQPAKDGLAALIIKPAFWGSLHRTKKFMDWAKAHQVRTVLSDIFSSGISVAFLANLAAAFSDGTVAMGLDTYRFLEQDILKEKLVIANGRMEIPENSERAKNVRFDMLERII